MPVDVVVPLHRGSEWSPTRATLGLIAWVVSRRSGYWRRRAGTEPTAQARSGRHQGGVGLNHSTVVRGCLRRLTCRQSKAWPVLRGPAKRLSVAADTPTLPSLIFDIGPAARNVLTNGNRNGAAPIGHGEP